MSRAATLKRLAWRMRELLLAWADFAQVLHAQTTIKTRNESERIVVLSTASELLGVSITPPYLTLRMLPYFVPKFYQWRRLARGEMDFTAEIKGVC